MRKALLIALAVLAVLSSSVVFARDHRHRHHRHHGFSFSFGFGFGYHSSPPCYDYRPYYQPYSFGYWPYYYRQYYSPYSSPYIYYDVRPQVPPSYRQYYPDGSYYEQWVEPLPGGGIRVWRHGHNRPATPHGYGWQW